MLPIAEKTDEIEFNGKVVEVYEYGGKEWIKASVVRDIARPGSTIGKTLVHNKRRKTLRGKIIRDVDLYVEMNVLVGNSWDIKQWYNWYKFVERDVVIDSLLEGTTMMCKRLRKVHMRDIELPLNERNSRRQFNYTQLYYCGFRDIFRELERL
jgi:hypothetical protein